MLSPQDLSKKRKPKCKRCWDTGFYFEPILPDGQALRAIKCDHKEDKDD